MIRRLATAIVGCCLLLCTPGPAWAGLEQPIDAPLERLLDELDVRYEPNSVIRIGESVRVRGGERVRGDIIAIHGDVRISGGGNVDGNVIAIGGYVRLSGGAHVEERAIALNGDVILSAGAHLGGDAIAVGGAVDRSPYAEVGGQVEHPLDDRLQDLLDEVFEQAALLQPRAALRGADAARVERSRIERRDQVAVGQRIAIPPDVRLRGDLVVVGGLLDVAGELDGDAVIVGGRVRVFETGEIRGDTVTFASTVERDIPLAEYQEGDSTIADVAVGWRAITRPVALALLIGLGVFGLVVLLFALLLEPVLEQAAVELEQGPVRALVIGLLLEVAIPPLLTLLGVTVVLLPVALLILLATALGSTVAMSLVSRQVGRRVLGGAGGGTLLRTLLGYLVLAALPALGLALLVGGRLQALGWMMTVLGHFVLLGAMTLGLGAVAMAQFGRWPRQSGATPAPATPIQSAD